MIILLSRRGYEAENLADFKGLNARSPWFALMMMFLMFSMAGVPPFVGFFGKLNVISAVVDRDYTGLAILMVLASVVGAYYYLRVIWYMYFEAAEDKAVLQASTDTRVVLSLNSVAVLASESSRAGCWHSVSRFWAETLVNRNASCVLSAFADAGWSSLAARRAHNPKVAGSNPAPATKT